MERGAGAAGHEEEDGGGHQGGVRAEVAGVRVVLGGGHWGGVRAAGVGVVTGGGDGQLQAGVSGLDRLRGNALGLSLVARLEEAAGVGVATDGGGGCLWGGASGTKRQGGASGRWAACRGSAGQRVGTAQRSGGGLNW
ncbi:glycine-rich protein DOT1-like [Phragmites australis]|uniref:glycine-rich protein DOT1-like n=1 Tax=Phragmites australis TaxID=29695 RepID=UPI002D7A2554|nr:glycine-rich protein DOT1-like [Phragmites australis]